LVATACIAVSVIPLALLVPLTPLAEGTSLATLALFALVNLALLRLRYRGVLSAIPHVTVPIWIPAIGLVTSIAMMAGALFR
jgi:amino acid transporter